MRFMQDREPFFNNEAEQILLQELLNAFQTPYILFDHNKHIKAMFLTDFLSNSFDISSEAFQRFLQQMTKTGKSKTVTVPLVNGDKILVQGRPVYHAGHLAYIAVILQSSIYKDDALDEYQNMAIDLKTIFESSYDVIFVSDGNGIALRVSSACEWLWGKKQEEMVGRSVYDLEREGAFRPSVTRLVLESKQKVSSIQKTSTGRTLLVVGTPVMDHEGNITRVINASRDITEIEKLQRELQEMKTISKRYQQEIEQLKNREKQFKKLIFRSQAMEKLIEQVKKLAEFNSTVLITGESGVGKEIIASLIHEWSNRSDKPFVRLNCGAIPETLLESELFGYEKGTFTGANKEGKTGLFYAANNGTLFLDEITEMPLSLQVKLLRFLQEGEIQRIGSIKPIHVDVRVIAATNRNIQDLIKQGKFREDLFYRLNVIPLEIPPLRQRKEDIPPLVDHFTKNFNDQYGTYKSFSAEAIQMLQQYEWKGNVRELQNIVERLMITSNHPVIDFQHVNSLLPNLPANGTDLQFEIQGDVDLPKTLELVEKQILSYASKKYRTTVEIAKALHINQSTVSRKLKKYNLTLRQGH
jgi:PAS domain S-box-containing protein